MHIWGASKKRDRILSEFIIFKYKLKRMKCLNICAVFIVGLSFMMSRAASAQTADNLPAGNNNMTILHSSYKPWARIADKDIVKQRRVW